MHESNSGPSYFTLEREGQFGLNTVGQFHCGTKDHLEIKYSLKVKCTATSLDDRGFLFDQLKVQEYFQSKAETAESCENFARHCGKDIFQQILHENEHCQIVQFGLTLSPEPFAARLTWGWESKNGKPWARPKVKEVSV